MRRTVILAPTLRVLGKPRSIASYAWRAAGFAAAWAAWDWAAFLHLHLGLAWAYATAVGTVLASRTGWYGMHAYGMARVGIRCRRCDRWASADELARDARGTRRDIHARCRTNRPTV